MNERIKRYASESNDEGALGALEARDDDFNEESTENEDNERVLRYLQEL